MSTVLNQTETTGAKLRELRLKAGLSQMGLSRRSGVHAITISHIEQGKNKPMELTWRRLIETLTQPPPKEEQPAGTEPGIFGEILDRGEFLRRLKGKMARSLVGFYSEFLVGQLIQALDFFSRDKFYPGDFSTGVEILGALLRAQRGLGSSREWEPKNGDDRKLGPYRRRKIKRRGKCWKNRAKVDE